MGADREAWHQAHDEPGDLDARRLAVVSALLGDAFAEMPPGPFLVLSLCAGEGRDLHSALTDHPRAGDVGGLLVEANPQLAARAVDYLAHMGTRLRVRCADAGRPGIYADTVPADVVLLCGIFGNVPVADIAATIAAVPALCRPGGSVLWTRHRRHPDITHWIRQQFHDIGCPATDFVSSGWGGFAVGRQRLEVLPPAEVPVLDPDRPLFTFSSSTSAPPPQHLRLSTISSAAWGRPLRAASTADRDG